MPMNVLVTGTGGASVGSGILHSLLRTSDEVRARWNVIATDADPFAWGLYVAPHRVRVPFARSPDYIDRIRSLVREYSLAAIIPGTELEIGPLLEHQQDLLPARVIANHRDLIPLMTDKAAVAGVLAKLGLPSIETYPLSDWRHAAELHGFPLVVKPTKVSGGSRGLHLVADPDEMALIVAHHDAATAPCVQPYIGSGDQEYTVGVLTDRDGELIDSIVMHRRLAGLSLFASRIINGRVCTISSGYSQGRIIRHPVIQAFCEKLALSLESRGPLNIQLRYDPDAQKCHAFEIHARFSGTTTIRADVGFNEVDLLLRNVLLGEKFGRLAYRHNVAAIRAFEHVIVLLAELDALQRS